MNLHFYLLQKRNNGSFFPFLFLRNYLLFPFFFLSSFLPVYQSFAQQTEQDINGKQSPNERLESLESWTQEPKQIPFFKKVDHTRTKWYLEMNSKKPNVHRAFQFFQSYFEKYPQERSRQYKLFKRWYSSARLYVDENGYLKTSTLRSYQQLKPQNSTGQQRASSGTWDMIGPHFSKKTKCNGLSNYMSGGYVDRVYINPYNTKNMLAGFSYGGLWVSQDKGVTWKLTDGEFPNGTNDYANNDRYYGDIEAAKSNSATIYAATEAGLLKSVNNGANWNYCNQLNRKENFRLRPYFLAVSPTNSEQIISTFGRKTFKSTDGGNSWKVVFDNSNGGKNHTFTSQHGSKNTIYGLYDRTYNFFGLEPDYGNANVYYLGAWNGNEEACIYKSTDAGETFQLLINLNKANNRTMPANLKLQTIGTSPGKFFVYPEWKTNDKIYTYNQNGTLLSEKVLATNSQAGDISWDNENVYYNGYYASSSIQKSTDGGATFTDMMKGSYGGCPDGNKYVHADVRAIDAIGDIILIGTDGGMSLSIDGMQTVKTIGDEISAVDLWGFASSTKSDICVAGMDHGPSTIRRFAGKEGWYERGGADAAHCSVNHSHDRWVYFDTQYGVFKEYVQEDGSLTNRAQISPPFNVNQLEFHPYIYTIAFGTRGKKLYQGNDNFRSFNTLFTFSNNIKKFRISRVDPTIMYVVLDNNTLHKSIDAGKNWANVTPSGGGNFIDIALGDQPDLVYIGLGNVQNNRKVLKSSNGGQSWENISTPNLPTAALSAITYQLGTDGGLYLAFAGMNGVWYRNNKLTEWKNLGSGLPMFAYVNNVFTVPNRGKYRMGSSRGAWEHDLYEPSKPLASFAVETNQVICSDQKVKFIQNSVTEPGIASYEWVFEGGIPSRSTAASPEVIYRVSGNYDVQLTVTDKNGVKNTKTIKDFIHVENECNYNIIANQQEKFNCENSIAESDWIAVNQRVLIKDFGTESENLFYIGLEIFSACQNKTASLKAVIHKDYKTIKVLKYNHFASTLQDPVNDNNTAVVTSYFKDDAQISLELEDNKLYLKLLESSCNKNIKLKTACWSSFCSNTIPETAAVKGGTEILLKDFANEEGEGLYLVELKSRAFCYNTTASLLAILDIPNQKIDVETYYHFIKETPSLMEGSGTAKVTSTSGLFSKISYRLDGTKLYFIHEGNACGSTTKSSTSCWFALENQCKTDLKIKAGKNRELTCNESTVLDVEVDGVASFSLNWDKGNVGDLGCTGMLQLGERQYLGNEKRLITDFCGRSSGLYYIDLKFHTNCYGTSAYFKGTVDLDNNKLNYISYVHFGTEDEISMRHNGPNALITNSALFNELELRLEGNKLYFDVTDAPCGPTSFVYVVNGNYYSTQAFVPNISGTYTVTVIDQNGCQAQDAIDITVPNQIKNLGTLQGNESQCDSYDPTIITFSTLPESSENTLQFRWLKRVVGADWEVIPNANANSFDPSTIAQSTQYTVHIKTETCDWIPTQSMILKEVTSNALTNLGVLQGDESQCGSFDPTNITFSSLPQGNINTLQYRWLQRIDGKDWTIIPNASSNSYDPTTISQSTQYTVHIKDGACDWLPTQSIISKISLPDTDKDGICDSIDVTIGNCTLDAPCDDGDENTIEDKYDENCNCKGKTAPPPPTPNELERITCDEVTIHYGNGIIKLVGSPNKNYYYHIFDLSWNTIASCGWQCGMENEYKDLKDGSYQVLIRNANWQLLCYEIITLKSEVITPPPTGGNAPSEVKTATCGDISITYQADSVHMKGKIGEHYYFKLNDLNNGWSQAFGCAWNCKNEQLATGLANSRYLVTIYNSDWSFHCQTEIELTQSRVGNKASGRSKSRFDFNAFRANRTVDVQWYSNAGFKVAHYEVERSFDGQSFEQINKLTNKKWTDKIATHSVEDNAPLKGKNYYRVKQIYLDGSYDYTETKAIDFNIDLKAISIFPNPIQNELFINLNPFEGKKANIQILNSYGQVIQTLRLKEIDGDLIKMNTADILNGFYFLNIEIEGLNVFSEKILIHRTY